MGMGDEKRCGAGGRRGVVRGIEGTRDGGLGGKRSEGETTEREGRWGDRERGE